MHFERKDISDDRLVQFYAAILLPRMIEEKMLVYLRQGRISKWFSGIGQEAIAVGASLALDDEDWIMPMHRNLGVFTTRNMPLSKLFLQWQGSKFGYSNGRERSFHFGTREHHICGMISHLGPQLAIADGVALAHKLRQVNKVALAFTGEGGTSEGDFHEALNVAAVWDLPVVFLIENNGYGLSTPVKEQYRCEHLIDKAKGYGIEGVQIDGNNLLTVYDTIRGVRDYCIRYSKPYLIECMTFRMRGHEEASGIKYVPKELLDEWSLRDPVKNYEAYLLESGLITPEQNESIKHQIKEYIDSELQIAHQIESGVIHSVDGSKDQSDEGSMNSVTSGGSMNFGSEDAIHHSGVEEELRSVYAIKEDDPQVDVLDHDDMVMGIEQKELRFLDAISEALSQSLEKHPELVLMGQDIAEYGGAFKVTEGFVEKFGTARIRNTPICESAIVGAALGLSLEGMKSVVEMQFADFVTMAFNQIVNNLAKIHYRWGQKADVVIRMPTGAGVGAGPFHSQSNEAWFAHVPGLKIVYPSSVFDAKGLLIAAINDPNPVLYFEHKALYRTISGDVPEQYYEVPIGKARIVQEGSDLSVITYGMGVHWAMKYAEQHPEYSIDILDLRTLLPLDHASIASSVKRTGRVLILHEDTLTGGIGSDIAAWISENCFEFLDAPVVRCASMDTPIPFSKSLEDQFLASSFLDEKITTLMNY